MENREKHRGQTWLITALLGFLFHKLSNLFLIYSYLIYSYSTPSSENNMVSHLTRIMLKQNKTLESKLINRIVVDSVATLYSVKVLIIFF